MMDQLVIGGLEPISIPQLGIAEIIAKVDTGAWSGALHCTNIRVRSGVLSFWPLGKESLKTKTEVFEQVNVRSANGQQAKRYLVPVSITLQGRSFESVIGLSDRSKMSREMLLGRRFLIENEILVDVSRTKELDDEAELIR